MGVMSYVTVVLISVFLMTSDVEHLFRCLLVICISSLEKHLCTSFAHFLLLVLTEKLKFLKSI